MAPQMNAQQVAHLALSMWDPDTSVTMVAIAGAESGFNPSAGGDTPKSLAALGLTTSAQEARGFNCPLGSESGPASIGLYQIFMPLHHAGLTQAFRAPTAPCDLAAWLKNPTNNTLAASLVLSNGGFTNWSTYNSGAYSAYLPQARAAVASFTGGTIPPGPGMPVFPRLHPQSVGGGAATALILLGLGAAVYVAYNQGYLTKLGTLLRKGS